MVGWRILKRLALQIPGTQSREFDRIINFPGGGFAQIKSADKPESLRGEGLDGVIVDEAAHIRKFDELWTQVLRPALSDRQGSAWFISTPYGFNEFYELYRRSDNDSNWSAFQFPTWSNPFIERTEIDAARGDLTDLTFRQEYGAEFVQLAGAMFRREWFQVTDITPSIRYVRFWDLAASTKTTADYTAGAKVGLTDDGTLVIADITRGRWEWPTALRIIADTARADGPSTQQGIEDVGVQKGMYQLLLAEPTLAGLTFLPVKVTTDKITRVNPWLARAEQSKVALVRANWNYSFLDEACAFPEVNHDDQVDAVSGAVQMLSRVGGFELVTPSDIAAAFEMDQMPAPSGGFELVTGRGL
jgi:predicted phage terminase large subunit-like protein